MSLVYYSLRSKRIKDCITLNLGLTLILLDLFDSFLAHKVLHFEDTNFVKIDGIRRNLIRLQKFPQISLAHLCII